MARYTLVVFLCCLLSAQKASSPAGKWVSDLKYFENDNYDRLLLQLNGNKLTGKLGNDQFEGTFQNSRIEGTVKQGPRVIKFTGVLRSDRIEGTATLADEKIDLKWEAYREPARSAGPHKTHTFEPHPV